MKFKIHENYNQNTFERNFSIIEIAQERLTSVKYVKRYNY